MRKRSVASVIIGNMLEFYDFNLVLVYSFILSKTFFPETDSLLLSVYRSMGVFILGVVARPLGALLFGHIGDLYGRKRALYLSMFLMALPCTAITILPDYKTVGILAPIIFIIARIIQGICTGGEYNGAAIYALENTPRRQGLVSGFVTASSISGVVLASLVQLTVQDHWRFAFLVGTGIAIFGIYMRSQLAESLEFSKRQSVERAQHPLSEAWRYHRRSLLLTFFVAGQLSVVGYLLLAGGPALLKMNPAFDCALLPYLTMGGAVIFAVSSVFFGGLSDYIAKQTGFIKAASVLSAVLVPFAFWSYKSAYLPFVIAGHGLLAVLCGLTGSTQHRFYQRLFPVHLRYSAIAVSFWLGTGIVALCVPIWCMNPSTPWLWPVIYTLFTGSIVWLYGSQSLGNQLRTQ